MRWQEWSKRVLWRLKTAGLSDSLCAACLSRLFHEPIDASSISATWQSMLKENWPRHARKARSAFDSSVSTQHLDNVVSCLLHYIDLRRAGHLPSQTELTIASDDSLPVRIRPTAETRSYIGSSASSCSDWGG